MTAASSDTRPQILATVSDGVRASVTETLATLCNGETTYTGSRNEQAPCDGVCGIISFVGDPCWSLMLGLPRQTATDLTTAFIGCELEYDGADMADAIGEVANIIAGDVVARLESQGIAVAMSLPAVARGHDVELMLSRDTPSVRLDFSSAVGDLWARVAMARSEETAGRGGACPVCGN
jgi:chemotaxis protein CheX